jgi:PelA/Pel-15E family pectate lyase
MRTRAPLSKLGLLPLLPILLLTGCGSSGAQHGSYPDTSAFTDGSHHWHDIQDEQRVITPLPGQPQYPPDSVERIADNILLFQKSNGGWPKNYDMRAVLTDTQKALVRRDSESLNTTFDNGATHSQIAYLAGAFRLTGNARYAESCLRGVRFILAAQHPDGGWPQSFPDTSGYRKHITFNDGAMAGVLKVLRDIAYEAPNYALVDSALRHDCARALSRGIECVLRCQVLEEGTLTGWGQQHDQETFAPRGARSFEPAALASMESAEILLFLMTVKHPSPSLSRALTAGMAWLERSALRGIRVETIPAPQVTYQFHRTGSDKVVVEDPGAPRIWSRYYELGTGLPLFCNRDGHPVYTLAEVERERRTGYAWYTYEPERAFTAFTSYQQK